MHEQLNEFLVVWSHSWRTRWTVWLTLGSVLLVQVLGRVLIDDIVLNGSLNPLVETIRSFLWDRYDAVSLGICISGLAFAFRNYRRDHARLMSL